MYCFTSSKIETGRSKISTFQNKAKPQDMIQLQADQGLSQELCLRGQEEGQQYGAFAFTLFSFQSKNKQKKIRLFQLLLNQLSLLFLSLINLRGEKKRRGEGSGLLYEFLFYSLPCTHTVSVDLGYMELAVQAATQVLYSAQPPSPIHLQRFLDIPNKSKVTGANCVLLDVRALFPGPLDQQGEVESLL